MSKIKDYILSEIENNSRSAVWIDDCWPSVLSRDVTFDVNSTMGVVQNEWNPSDDEF